jgi:phosphohistidine swiveling domain-containing protein
MRIGHKQNMIYTADNTNKNNINKLGGKAANLFYLTKAGLPVPPWFVIPIDSNIDEMQLEIKNAYNQLIQLGQSVAVRSSASLEDNTEVSFAGQFKTILNIQNFDDLLIATKQVKESANSEIVQAYLTAHQMDKSLVKMGVIVQVMIEGDVAGVMFTANPTTGNLAEVMINSALGQDSVVSGEETSVYVIDKNSRVIKDSKIVNGSLSKEQVYKLIELGSKIETQYGAPQDIEWTFKDGKPSILQSRPITNLPSGEEQLWDNSNIAESYSGFTLPLTASFARHIYSVVYQEVALTSGIPRKIVEENKHLFDNMLGFFKGRFYYNMYNWYRLLLFFPAFGFTKNSMEQMMSVRETADFQEPTKMSKVFKVRYSIRAFYRFLTFNMEVKSFKDNFNLVFDSLVKKDMSNLSEEELINLYYKVESKILCTWHTPVDNDFLLMVFYGLLRKLTHRFHLDKENPGIYNDLISNIRGVISAEQTNSLIKIAQMIRSDQANLILFEQEDSKIIWQKINTNDLGELSKHINTYLDTFGSRFANELKLEEPNLQETPEKFIKLLKIYVSTPNIDLDIKKHNLVRKQAEEYLNINLNLVKRKLVFWALHQSERFLKNREEMRLMRSNMFGFVRNVFRNIGQNFAEQKIINQSHDIFYLEIDEVIRFIEGSATNKDLKPIIELRIKEFEGYKNEEIEDRFVTHGIPYLDLPLSKPKTKLESISSIMKGMPCSSGKAEGRVQVMKQFSYNINEDASILVAKHTDPGWTPIFSRFSGIIVENGGQLSHAAIVSRELGIPCIVGVKNITEILENGDLVSMDGSRGELIIKKQK